MLTLQEIFTKVKDHLLLQAHPARDKCVCLYRTSEGLKCAVGALIDDQHYTKELEGSIAATLGTPHCSRDEALQKALFDSGVDGVDIKVRKLLVDLQGMHDSVHDVTWVENIKAHLKRIASINGLQY